MICEINNIGLCPLNGSEGHRSARPSVKLNLCELSTPVAPHRQPRVRSGFPQGGRGAIRVFPGKHAPTVVDSARNSGPALAHVMRPDTGYSLHHLGYPTRRAELSPSARHGGADGRRFFFEAMS